MRRAKREKLGFGFWLAATWVSAGACGSEPSGYTLRDDGQDVAVSGQRPQIADYEVGPLEVAATPCESTEAGQPYCQLGPVTDPDGDGLGDEGAGPCVVLGSEADPQPGSCQLVSGAGLSRINYEGRQLFLSGFNVAWFQFASDFGRGLNETRLREALRDLTRAGGNTLRWWVHTDGSVTPSWGAVDGTTLVTSPGANCIRDMERALDIAAEFDAFIVPSLWSFDMLQDNGARNPPTADNYRLLSDDEVLRSYIDNALVPMVEQLNSHPALVAWELFNEPENMTEGWFVQREQFYGGDVPSLERLQRTQGLMAAAIHRTAERLGQVALVTTGSKSMGKYNSDVATGRNLYRDDRLIAAADGDELATLDFYEPHYYNNEGRGGAWSPFHHPAAYWEVDKPIVLGEFYTTEPLDVLGEAVAGEQMCQRLADFGYAGGWPWQWNEYLSDISPCLSLVSLP